MSLIPGNEIKQENNEVGDISSLFHAKTLSNQCLLIQQCLWNKDEKKLVGHVNIHLPISVLAPALVLVYLQLFFV